MARCPQMAMHAEHYFQRRAPPLRALARDLREGGYRQRWHLGSAIEGMIQVIPMTIPLGPMTTEMIATKPGLETGEMKTMGKEWQPILGNITNSALLGMQHPIPNSILLGILPIILIGNRRGFPRGRLKHKRRTARGCSQRRGAKSPAAAEL